MADPPDLRLFGTVFAPGGDDRLCLIYAAVGMGGFDFHSLVWEARVDDTWTTRLTIAREQFSSAFQHYGWISEIHSFEPALGHAIIQVAEGDAAPTAQRAKITYSWRLWDLPSNREIAVLKRCENSFDRYVP